MEEKNKKASSYKAFARLAIASLYCVLICVIVLSSGTHAWFSDSVESQKSTLQTSGDCHLSVSLYKDGAEKAVITADKENTVSLDCQGVYIVTLTLPKDSASGYLVMRNEKGAYYTDCLRRNEESDQTLTFTLNVAGPESISFTARWGVYSGECHVKNGEELALK